MKRFLRTFALLNVSLFLLVTGVDEALDQLAHSTTQCSFTEYNEKGAILVAYDGDLTSCKAYATKPTPVVVPAFLHRT